MPHSRRYSDLSWFHLCLMQLTDILPNHSMQEHLDSSADAFRDSMNRMSYRLFQMMAERHNFSIFYKRSNKWGYTVNGSWIGVIGLMVRREVDFAVTPLRWSPERYGWYEPTSNMYDAHVMFIFRHPKSSINASNIFLVPFSRTVWICIVLVGITFSIALRHIFMVEKHRTSSVRLTTDQIDTTYSNTMLLVFGTLFQQGFKGAIPMRSNHSQCILLFKERIRFPCYRQPE